jgi:hypothetical protein
LDSPCTGLLLTTSCNFLLHTLCSCLRLAPSSPHYKCRLSSAQTSRSLPNNRGMPTPHLVNTCLCRIRCTGLVPVTPCMFLPRTVCTIVHRAHCSLHCTCKLPALCSLAVQSKNVVGTRSMSWPHLLLQNMSLPHIRCTDLLPLRPCTFRPRTLCTPLQLGQRSPPCRCSSSELCSQQAIGKNAGLDRRCIVMIPSKPCTFLQCTVRTCLRRALSGPPCTCKLSALCSADLN